MEGKLDAFLGKMEEEKERTDGHEARISKLESWQAWTFGASAAIGVIVGMFWKIYPMLSSGR